jgi:hypothetical protein
MTGTSMRFYLIFRSVPVSKQPLVVTWIISGDLIRFSLFGRVKYLLMMLKKIILPIPFLLMVELPREP